MSTKTGKEVNENHELVISSVGSNGGERDICPPSEITIINLCLTLRFFHCNASVD